MRRETAGARRVSSLERGYGDETFADMLATVIRDIYIGGVVCDAADFRDVKTGSSTG
jgi:hypothetical protein